MATEKALIKIQSGTAALRQEGTTYFDNRCMAVALQCPKGPADQCAPWVKCKEQRGGLYAGTNGIQLMVAAGLNLVGIDDEQGAKKILVQVTAAVLELHQKLKELQVYEAAMGATKLFSAPDAPAAAPAVVAPSPALAPAVALPLAAPASAPAKTGGTR